MKPNNSPAAGPAAKRIQRALCFKKPDRIPVVFYFDFYAARRRGLTGGRFVSDPAARRNAVIETLLETGADGFMIGRLPGPYSYAAGGFPNRILLPGKELPEDSVWQFDESQPTMAVEDYGRVARLGWERFLPELLPRFSGYLPDQLPALQAQAEAEGLEDLAAWGEAGVPLLCGGAVTPPFEVLAAARTLPRFFIDLRRHPEQVLSAMEAMQPEFIRGALKSARFYGIPRIVISASRCSGAMISPAHFERFALPFLRNMVESFCREGMGVMLHLDADWTVNLPYFLDFPRGCILHTDSSTDLLRAGELLGGHFVLMGDVPAALLSLGTPAQVAAYCRTLVKSLGSSGGFILSSGCDVPVDARPENVRALAETAAGA